MLLNVNLPNKKEDSIDLSEISSKYKGILIVFVKNVCVGFIIYDTYDYTWNIYNDISLINEYDIIPTDYNCNSLIEIVNILKSRYDNTISIKALPFKTVK